MDAASDAACSYRRTAPAMSFLPSRVHPPARACPPGSRCSLSAVRIEARRQRPSALPQIDQVGLEHLLSLRLRSSESRRLGCFAPMLWQRSGSRVLVKRPCSRPCPAPTTTDSGSVLPYRCTTLLSQWPSEHGTSLLTG